MAKASITTSAVSDSPSVKTVPASAGTTSDSNSSSSGSNGSSAPPLGPRRFRGDVPAFNPSQPHAYTQQMDQYLSQNSRLQSYFVPAQQQYMFQPQMMAYYPQMMGYPDYSPFQQFPYYQFHNQGYVNHMAGSPNIFYQSNSASSMNNSRKRYNKDFYHHGHSNPDQNSSEHMPNHPASLPTGVRNNDLRHSEPKTADPKYLEKPSMLAEEGMTNKSKSEDVAQTKAELALPKSEQNNELDEKKLTDPKMQDHRESVEAEIDEEKMANNLKDFASVPLLFETSLKDFLTEHKLACAFNRKLLAAKSTSFDLFLDKNEFEINKQGLEYIVNHNTNEEYYKRIHPGNKSQKQLSIETSEKNFPPKIKAPLAWLAVLQANTVKSKKIDGISGVNGLVCTSTSSTETPVKDDAPVESSDSPQSLGVLMMQYLFDPMFKYDDCDIYAQKPRGLTNSGNICYMNVVLQCLIFSEPFTSLFHLVQSKSIANTTCSPTPLIDATIDFFKDYLTIPSSKKSGGSFNSNGIVVGKPLSPENFYQKLIENPKFQHLSWGQQEDAEEFLSYFLDGIHEEFVKVEASVPMEQMERLAEVFAKNSDPVRSAPLKAAVMKAARLFRSSSTKHIEESEVVSELDANDWAEVGSGRRVCKKRVVEVEPSPITKLFEGRFRSVLSVPKSKEQQSITLDPFRCILLDLSLEDIRKVEDALWKFNEVEKLPFKVDAGKEVVARKQTFIDELPEVLVLHMKRFSYQNDIAIKTTTSYESNGRVLETSSYGTIEKVMKNILYGLSLTVPPESLSAPLRRDNLNQYSLTAVIYHHGRKAEGGHYTCDVMRSNKNWLRIDDTAVKAIDAESVLDMSDRDKSAYILMYQRKK